MMPIDQPDIMNRMSTTTFAITPICLHKEIGSQPMPALSWNIAAANAGMLLRTRVARFAKSMVLVFLLRNSESVSRCCSDLRNPPAG
jgi:hypothetical protein